MSSIDGTPGNERRLRCGGMVAAGLSTVSSSRTTSPAAPRLPAGEGLLHARALTVGYDGIPILPPLTLTVGAGELWAVIGPNGAGKSTFVRTALGLSRPVGGTIERRPGLRLAYVPQQSALDAIFPVSVLDFVLMGLQGTDNVTLANPGAYLGRARAALAEAGVETLARRQLRDLSGGQRQRVLMARALATDADSHLPGRADRRARRVLRAGGARPHPAPPPGAGRRRRHGDPPGRGRPRAGRPRAPARFAITAWRSPPPRQRCGRRPTSSTSTPGSSDAGPKRRTTHKDQETP